MNRLTQVTTGGFDANLAPLPASQAIVLDKRLYDAAGRQVQSGPAGTLPQAYINALNAGGAADANGARTRTARYDDNGRLIAQHITKPDGTFDYDLVYAGTTTNTYDVDGGVDESGNPVIIQQTITTTGAGYDGAGNVLGYQVSDSSGVTSSYNFTQALFEGYKESSVSGTRSDNPGQGRTTTSSYDINGHLISVTGNDEGRVARSFINDTNGIILQQSSGDANAPTSITRQIVANGQVFGSYGFAQPSGTLTHPAINFNNLPPGMVLGASTYDASFQPINSGYPTASVGSYLVQTGDTLQSIAQSAYGDRQLWFVIAQANGLMGDADLKVGMSLTIPSKVGSVHNTSDTFKPYNPGELIGDTAPTLPVPQNDDDDCGFMGQLIMIVVAVVVTYLTAGAATGVWGSVFGVGSTAATVAGAATAAALGSIASQVVGNALGIVDGFSWKAVALAAIAGGVGGGVDAAFGGAASGLGDTVLRAVIKNAVTQGIGVATGLQDSFDWRGVAAAGIGAGVGYGVGQLLGDSTNSFDKFAKNAITGLASGVASAATRGGKINISSIAADAFGNALGGAFISSMSTPSPASQGAGAGSGGSSYINGLDLDGDYSGGNRFSAASTAYGVAGSVQANNGYSRNDDYAAGAPRSGMVFTDGGWMDPDGGGGYGSGDGSDPMLLADARTKLPRGWSTRNGVMYAPDGTDMGPMRGAVNINIRDGLGSTRAPSTVSESAPSASLFPESKLIGINDQGGQIWSTGTETYPVIQPDIQGVDLEALPVQGTGLKPPSSSGTNLALRFGTGVLHGAVDMVWQPLAQVLDLGQAAYGFTYGQLTGGLYEPRWLSGIGQNYAAGMSYGETVTRAVLGSNPVTGVGVASYDLTSSALQNDWGGVAEGLGGLTGGFAAAKYGQRYFAPEPGAELGIYRARPPVDMTDPSGLAPTLPGREVPNFTSAEPISLGGRTLNRVFDTTDPSRAAGGAKPNGGYWTEQVYSNETSWRTGVAVPEKAGWNKGTRQGEWQPADGYGWGGNAAPQLVPNYSFEKWGFSAGWIQRGGDRQIFVPNSYNSSVIPTGGIKITPTPWSKP